MSQSENHHDPLLIIRAVACLVVIWTHIFPQIKISFQNLDLSFIYSFNSSVAVFTFYLLSAFGVGYGFASGRYKHTLPSLVKFYITRLLRIAPIYYLAIILGVFVLYKGVFETNQIIRLFTFTATDMTSMPAMTSLAIVSTEMQFYLIAPLLSLLILRFFRKLPFLFSALIIFTVGNVVRMLLEPSLYDTFAYSRNVFASLIGNIDTFTFGMLLSYAVFHQQHKPADRRIFLWMTSVVLLVAWIIRSSQIQRMILSSDDWMQKWFTQMLYVVPPATSITFGLLIWLLTTGTRTPIRKNYSTPQLLRLFVNPLTLFYALGVLSYGIYIWQATIVKLLIDPLNVTYGLSAALQRFGLLASSSIFLSFITNVLVEKPVAKLRQMTISHKI